MSELAKPRSREGDTADIQCSVGNRRCAAPPVGGNASLSRITGSVEPQQPYSRHDDGSETVPIKTRTTSPLIAAPTGDDGVVPWTTCVLEQPWWLDAVSPGAWAAATVIKGGEVYARLPYGIRKKYGLTLVGNPALSPGLGPWFRPWRGKYAGELGEQKELTLALIRQLPDCALFAQTFSPLFTNALPFRWSGYQHTTHCTYRIEELKDLDRVWSEFTNERRNVIRRAQKLVAIRDDLQIDVLYELLRKTWARQGRTPPVTRELVGRVHAAAHVRNACQLLFAEDAQGCVHAGVFVLQDNRCAYYLLGGGDPQFKASGAYSLLVWEAIKAASSVAPAFDFAGSSDLDIEHFFRTFGPRQRSLIQANKMSRQFAVLNASKDLFQAIAGKKIRWLF